jgi:hypothetical protein
LLALALFAPEAKAQDYLVTDEARVRELVNQARFERDLPSLSRHEGLAGLARAQSVRMVKRGDIYHNPGLVSEVTGLGIRWLRVGENVGYGPDVAVIEQAFLDSPDHLHNIIDPSYNAIGVGVVPGDGGRIYVTQVFAQVEGAVPPPSPRVPVSQPAPTTVPEVPPPSPPALRTQAPLLPSPAPLAVQDGIVTGGSIFEPPAAATSLFAQVVGVFR